MAGNALAIPEQKRLAELEAAIAQGLQTFMEVGTALIEIRTQKLYRETHGTFAAYCEERWQITDRRARQLISAAEIGTRVPIPSERHARALAPLIADRGLDAAGVFLVSQLEGISAADLEQAVGQELNPIHPAVQADAEEFGRLLRKADCEELADYLLQINPGQKFPHVAAAVMKLEHFQREAARSLVAAVQAIIEESEEGISLEEAVGEMEERAEFLTTRGFALINFDAMKAFAEGSGPNEVDRVTQLAWQLAENGVCVKFTEHHFVQWCEAELQARAA